MCSSNIFGHKSGEASSPFQALSWLVGFCFRFFLAMGTFFFFFFSVFKNKAMSERFRALKRQIISQKGFQWSFKKFYVKVILSNQILPLLVSQPSAGEISFLFPKSKPWQAPTPHTYNSHLYQALRRNRLLHILDYSYPSPHMWWKYLLPWGEVTGLSFWTLIILPWGCTQWWPILFLTRDGMK